MKPSRILPLLLLAAGLLTVPHGQVLALSDEEIIQVTRSVIAADRQAVVANTLQLTAAESEKFWPLYHQYRAELDTVADRLVKIVQEYAAYYPEVPDSRAQKMLKDLTGLEKKLVATRASFLKKFGKALPAAKNLRFAQIENRLDLALRLKLAANIPLVPVEGRMAATATGAALYAQGVPGGVMVQTCELTAMVASIDATSRKVTLVSPEGIKQTVRAGPEVINFDQIQVGDQLKVTATEQLVVRMAPPGEPADDRVGALVALAPKGARPGGVMAETMKVTATVAAIDSQKRTATLRFEDGSTRTFPVRADVDLSQRKVGDRVVFRVTEMIAISVEKP